MTPLHSSLPRVVLFTLVLGISGSRLDIKDGGFEGFVVAVNRDVPQSPALVQELKDLIRDTSNILFDTVGLHMRSVNILVPSTWQRDVTWEKTSKLTFDDADMRVDKPHPFYRNRPYTHPTWQCGQMQKYIHVTPAFVDDGQTKFKNRGTLLANQFGTYRYGVFEDIVNGKKNESTDMPKTSTHERVCGGRTAWEVVKGHNDLQHTGHSKVDTVFTVVYNENDQSVRELEKDCGRPVVLLLDFSASMGSHNRLLRQEQVGSKFIKEILPLGSQVGIIGFANFTEAMVMKLQTLAKKNDKTKLIDKLSTETLTRDIGFLTGIGTALLHALSMLKQSGQPVNESRIVLLTDGEENVEPYIDEVMEELLESKVKVHSIAVGDKAAEGLGRLSTKTGGQLGQYLEGAGSATFNQVVNNLWSDFNMQCVEPKPIEIETRTFKLDDGHKVIEETVSIDEGLDTTDFTFTAETDQIKVKLSAPDHTTYDEQSPEYRREQFKVIRFTMKDIQPGEWKIGISNMDVTSSNGGEQVIMNVKAKGKNDAKTYEVRSWVNSVIVKIPAVTQIYAEVTKDYSPLIKANVTATVGTRDGTVTLDLKDDGKPPDIRALDGVYTGEFIVSTKTSAGSAGSPRNERYSVDITVTPVEGETQLVQELRPRGEEPEGEGEDGHIPSLYDLEIRKEDIVSEPVSEKFQRKGTPGAIEVKNIQPGVDQYPPSRVEDLTLTLEGEGVAKLEWTAPGNDLRKGTASEYEIRLWYNSTELRADLSVGIMLSPDMLISGSLTPSTSGSEEVIRFHLPDALENHLVFVAMVARDEAAHQSDVSVIAMAVPSEPEYNIMEDPASLILYIYAAVFFVTRLMEMTALRGFLS